MKLTAMCVVVLLLFAHTAAAHGRFEHIVVIVQENRTPDNLFQGLCAHPLATQSSAAPCQLIHNMTFRPKIGRTRIPSPE